MSRKIKLNIFTLLFRFFAFCADKTNGWYVFVRPKLLFGSLIIGLGITSCHEPNKPKNSDITTLTTDSIQIQIERDTLKSTNTIKNSKSSSPTLTPPLPPIEATCYEVVEVPDTAQILNLL